tara:strand:+ start:26556 stop:27128 length:573 start_codon:yes stop_codon:yes gene_type:complete
MLEVLLEKEQLIASGLHRQCYEHPDNHDLCLKVVVNGDMTESNREEQYYTQMQRKKVPWTHIPAFHGVVRSNLGRGAAFTLIRNADGAVSQTLETLPQDSSAMESLGSTALREALEDLRQYLLRHSILTMTVKPKNIAVQMLGKHKARLIIVDNLGCADFLPLAKYISALARRKTQRRWQRFIEKLQHAL